jgi:hypothetical protein
MQPKIVTIGVYGFDEDSFFEALCKAKVDTFCDIRSRRGVRGSTYAFANSLRLQTRLAELGIRYLYRKDLAPTQAVRDRQAAADKVSPHNENLLVYKKQHLLTTRELEGAIELLMQAKTGGRKCLFIFKIHHNVMFLLSI